MIIAVSDVHIGYSESDSMEFGRFLADDLWEENNISDLVLCGDIFDLWRGAIPDVMIEGSGIVRDLKHLNWKYGINITFIAGNHDYLLRNSRVKPFKFNTFKTLEEGGVKYTFIHGWEDDPIQNREFFDVLCYTDNRTGEFVDGIWQNYLGCQSYLTRLWKSLFELKSREQMRMMMKPPGERNLEWFFGSYKSFPKQMAGDVTVMGHTHSPGTIGNVVNCGSWCSDSPVHNTYVVIDGDTVEVRRYEG
jgi:UDP-2,3-diacylglucosamine pyrophosphatase LpxH